jgi:hypothetical protein
MKIDELDEFQGITSEMLQAWLLANGWKQVEQMAYQLDAPPVRTGWLFRRGDETVGTGADISYVLAKLSRLSCKTPQALLREINPRMRKGMPSRAALEAHGENGDWVVFRNVLHAVRFVWTVCDAVQMVSGFDVFRGDNPEDAAMIAECSFWPCDKHGNKVRWPTDAEGKML